MNTKTLAKPTQTYSNKSNCVAGARTLLANKAAKLGVDFDVAQGQDGRWSWRPLPAAVVESIQASVKQQAAEIAATLNAPETMTTEEAAQQLLAYAGPNGVPAFLARPKPTAEETEALAKKTAKTSGRDRELKNPKTPAKRNAHNKAAASLRPDGLRVGSKQSMMLDMALRKNGATEAEICEELGWRACLVTLRRTCEKVGASLTREPGKDGAKSRYYAKMPK